MVESISKTPVSVGAARSIVADAFGSDAELTTYREFGDGWFNAAYELVLGDGRAFVMKVAPPPDIEVLTYERDIVHAEIAALRLVREHTDAPVPTVVWVDDRCTHVPSPLFVMTRLPGVSLWNERESVDAAQRADLDRAIGAHLRAMNEITGTSFGSLSPVMPRHERWSDAFGGLVDVLLEDGERRSVVLPIAADDVRAVVAASVSVLDEVTEPRLVHWDLWDGNVLIEPESRALCGLLDYERALWGDPLMETQFGPPGASAALIDGYGVDVLSTAGERHRRALYTLYLHLVMSIEGTYRQYPEDPFGDWARGQLRDDLDRVLSQR